MTMSADVCKCGHDRGFHGELSLVCLATSWETGGKRKCYCDEYKRVETMNTDKLNATEENALKWVLLCEHLGIDPLVTTSLEIRSHFTTAEYGPDYYVAARDAKGNIRLNKGRGLHVANPENGYADVLGWFDMATETKWKKGYGAALRLIMEEDRQKLEANGG